MTPEPDAPERPAEPEAEPWLVRPDTIRLIWRVGIATLAVLTLLDLVIPKHPHFAIEGSFGFGAWYGFLACVVLVLAPKLLGALLKRPDGYYDD